MININFFLISTYYLFLGLIFNVISLKFSKREISLWTNQATALSCSTVDIKWLGLNFICLLYFSHVHLSNLEQLGNEIIHLKEFFRGLIICLWISLLVVMAKIDLKANLLPDCLNLTLAIFGVVFSMFYENIDVVHSFSSAFLGFAYIMLSIFFFTLFKKNFSKNYSKSREPPFGRGDIFLITVIGLWVGWEILLLIVLFSSLIMIVIFIYGHFFYKWNLSKRLPFGPILCLLSIFLGTPQLLVIY